MPVTVPRAHSVRLLLHVHPTLRVRKIPVQSHSSDEKMCAGMYIFLVHILYKNNSRIPRRIKLCQKDVHFGTRFFAGFCGVLRRRDSFIRRPFIDRYGTPYGVLNYYDSKIKYYHPPVSYF